MTYPPTPDVFDTPTNPSSVPSTEPGDTSPARDMLELLIALGGGVTAVQTALEAFKATKAQASGLASLDGSGTVPDAQIPAAIARDSEVSAAVAALVASAPATLDTLDELAAALGDDPNFATTIAASIGTKVAKSLYDANSLLTADSDDTPAALTMGASTILARLAAGNIKAATPAELKTLLAIAESDVTNLTSDLAAKVAKSLYDANTILYADTDDTPAALTVGASTLVGRKASGGIAALTPAEVYAIGLAVSSDATAAYVAGAYIAPAFSTLTTLVGASGQLYALPIPLVGARTVDRISAEITAAVAATTLRLGIYAHNYTTGLPGTLILDAGTINGNSATVQEITISQAVTGPIVWVAALFEGGAPTARAQTGQLCVFPGASAATVINGSVNYGGIVKTGVTTGSLPGTFPTPNAYNPAPRVALRLV